MLHFIYNPQAGHGRTLEIRQRIEGALRVLGVEYDFHEPNSRERVIAMTRMLTEGSDDVDIIAIGGDGSLNAVLNGLRDPAKVRLGLIPCGSGNDFAAHVGIPKSPEAALGIILRGNTKDTDYMECSGVRAINAIGAGIDVEILRRYAKMKRLRGSAAYLASLVRTLFTFKPFQFLDITNNANKHHRALIACAGNGSRFGGGITICPEAKVDDGLMDIVIVDNIPKPALPLAFMKLMQKKILTVEKVRFKRQTALKLVSSEPMPVEIDGEIHERLPFDVKLIHGKLRVFRP